MWIEEAPWDSFSKYKALAGTYQVTKANASVSTKNRRTFHLKCHHKFTGITETRDPEGVVANQAGFLYSGKLPGPPRR